MLCFLYCVSLFCFFFCFKQKTAYEMRISDWSSDVCSSDLKDTSCVVVQYPDILGRIKDLNAIAAKAHEVGALLVAVVTEPVALGAITAPGEMGADIVVGEGQSIGVGLQFGGPYLGLFATKHKYVRQMPGRLCGQTLDAEGKRGFVLTLSTREQHIRREKATSNICTNSGLCALAFSIRSEEQTSELQSLMRISYADFCLNKNNKTTLQPFYNSTTS